MDLGIAGKRAAVAAASAGLGFATAEALAAEGVRVAICSRDRERVEEAASKLGSEAVALTVDLSTPEEATRFVAEARERLGGLDILVCNAGGPPAGNFAQTEVEDYPAALSLNLLSTIAMCKEGVPGMQEQRWGRVLAITSLAVRQPIGGLILSNTARSGATAFLKTLARDVAGDGVTVNSIQPGLHRTARLTQLFKGNLDALAQSIPAGFLGTAEDFGHVAAFLCSEHARFITGSAIALDGGACAALL
jgi:3-oxoacyl-[acyl-carrier protein] reductase